MNAVRTVVTSLAVLGVGMALGAGAYESVVMAPNFATNVPTSLEHVRGFMVSSNPGSYFRILAPATQLLLLLSVVLNWRVPGSRWWMMGGLVLMIATDVITFSYHYPRNEIMFVRPLLETPQAQLEAAAREWGSANYVRVGLLVIASVCALRGLAGSLRFAGR